MFMLAVLLKYLMENKTVSYPYAYTRFYIKRKECVLLIIKGFVILRIWLAMA